MTQIFSESHAVCPREELKSLLAAGVMDNHTKGNKGKRSFV